ncbi:MAG TPA: hypothetical protein PKN48_16085, partial [Bacteroidales bacterium]|nr:hypothetical protein [Bacteroidales bacterium]
MKKIYKTLTLFVSLLWMGNVCFGQPACFEYDILPSMPWTTSMMADRGVTMATLIQSSATATMTFLFNNASFTYNPKWCGSTTDFSRNVNQKYNDGAYHYTIGGWDHNLTCPVQSLYFYTAIIGKNAGSNNNFSIVETSYYPVSISSVAQSPASNVLPGNAVDITVTLSSAKNTGEYVFVRYTTDNWATSSFLPITSFNASFQGTVAIPGQAGNTTVSYYALTTNQAAPDVATIDYFTLSIKNNSNSNYSYTVKNLNWCNLQSPSSGSISLGGAFNVYAKVYVPGITDVTVGQAAGIQAWIGYSTSNTDPSTWTNWVPAAFNVDVVNDDEYVANIGPSLPSLGTYYYASRFQLGSSSYYYGGLSGFWTSGNSGTITVNDLTWCNLQSPPSGTCVTGSTYMVYSRVYAQGLTDATSGQAAAGIQAWIGYSTSNTDPSTWTNWVAATYNTDFGNNDEYQANIGSALPAGSYFYASRFQLGSGPYHYGGYEANTGGFWDGSNYISGAIAVIPAPPTVTLQTLSAPAGNVAVNIDMTGFSMGISAFQWRIYYDPAVLTYSGISNWAAGFNGTIVDGTTPGEIFFIFFDAPVNFSGTLCQIDFTSYSGASCTNITWETDPLISNIKWDDVYFYDYSVNWVNGQLCPCSATSPVWWTGAVSTDWNTSGNWSCTVPTGTNDVTIPFVANMPVISSAPAFCRNLTIDAGASVTVNSGNTLSVYGNWLSVGQSNAGSGTVALVGNTAQTINGTTTFGNLTLNNTNGANLNGNTQVSGVLTLTQGTLTTGGFLTLLSTATNTALIAGTGSGSVSGNVTMQRYMPSKLGYHYYSSPFAAAPVSEFADEIGTITSGDPYGGTNDTLQTVTPFPNFYAYDETPQFFLQIGWTGAGATMTPMRGYCINFGAAGGALTTDVTGMVNNGPLSYPVTKTASPYPAADGWNLVGNPYPSPIDWNATSGWNKSNIVNSVYFFNPTTQYTGTYSSYAGGIGVPGDINGIIPAMQGFFVKATGNGPFSVTNSVRISELNPVFHKSMGNTTLLRLKGYPAANEASGDETVIYFDAQATNMFDDNFDAYKWINNDPAFPNLFTRDDSPSS